MAGVFWYVFQITLTYIYTYLSFIKKPKKKEVKENNVTFVQDLYFLASTISIVISCQVD